MDVHVILLSLMMGVSLMVRRKNMGVLFSLGVLFSYCLVIEIKLIVEGVNPRGLIDDEQSNCHTVQQGFWKH